VPQRRPHGESSKDGVFAPDTGGKKPPLLFMDTSAVEVKPQTERPRRAERGHGLHRGIHHSTPLPDSPLSTPEGAHFSESRFLWPVVSPAARA